jgi:hypothetical protein
MRQTSIDWLLDQMTHSKELYDDQGYSNPKVWEELLAQAKAKHKEEIIDFHKWMVKNDTRKLAEKYFHFTDSDMLNEYYNETYGGEK